MKIGCFACRQSYSKNNRVTSCFLRHSVDCRINPAMLDIGLTVQCIHTLHSDHDWSSGWNGGKLKKVIGLPPKSNPLVSGPGPRFASKKFRVQIVQRTTGSSSMSGRFSPLTAPLAFRDLLLHSPLVFPTPALICSSDFLAGSVPFSAPLTLRSNALLLCSHVCVNVTSELPTQVLCYLVLLYWQLQHKICIK